MAFRHATAFIRPFPTPVWVMLLGTLLTRTAYFMVWPFLAILLYRTFHLSATAIGALLALASVLGSATGVYSGYLSDVFRRRTIMLIGAGISAGSFALLAYADALWVYATAISGINIGRALLEASSKALVGDHIVSAQVRESAQYFRYFLVNVGSAVGPYIGLVMGLSAQQPTFLITGCIYGLFAVLLRLYIPDSPATSSAHGAKARISFAETLHAILHHRSFMILVFCCVLVMFVYGNFESTMVQYISRSGVDNAVGMVATLVMVNSVTIIFCQLPLLHLLRRYTPSIRIVIGMVLLAVAQLGFAFAPLHTAVYLCAATVVLSLGEVVAFPTFNVEIDRITPHHLSGAFFGASNMSSIGSALAPLYGGIMLDYSSAPVLFSVLTVVCLTAVSVYYFTVARATTRS